MCTRIFLDARLSYGPDIGSIRHVYSGLAHDDPDQLREMMDSITPGIDHYHPCCMAFMLFVLI